MISEDVHFLQTLFENTNEHAFQQKAISTKVDSTAIRYNTLLELICHMKIEPFVESLVIFTIFQLINSSSDAASDEEFIS